ncbi:MAG: Dam family site-specific DNA-(adenine-N6)-methyltransferase, partial [Candidatus Hydrogenedentes bacterium]|nr:Dam family site-specific DNA-(adenine-N6)-methyltransferase [Candidatus Hydrogenedentota bacterium]
GPVERYPEPFRGGGAVFFGLTRTSRFGKWPWLSDTNPRLIETYCSVREDVDGLIRRLKRHAACHSKEYYYETRDLEPKKKIDESARLIYLNKTCFNGLYRENKQGRFNVPIGRYTNPTICDEENLRAVSKALKRVRLESMSFEQILDRAESGDLVYFDPPYHPVSSTASFTAYAKNGFGEDGQRKLASVYSELSQNGVKVLLSNSDTPFTRKLYRKFRPIGVVVNGVMASRQVNSRADRRGKVSEILVQNF